MTIKAPNRRSVEFFATSSRMAHAYRCAVRLNKSLSHFAEFRVFGDDGGGKVSDDLSAIVLSHADEDHFAFPDAKSGSLFTEAFHLLFTEPTTHPDQVAQWMRGTNIRSENRLHVVRVESMEAPEVAQLLGRVCFALGKGECRGGIIDAYLAGDRLLVRGPQHRMLHVPIDTLPALKGLPHDALRNFAIDPDGSFIVWPDLNVHLGWKQFLQATDPAEFRKAQQRSAGFNERYGQAIRKVREAAGISQSKVPGITDRQLRRIESGVSRATSSALAALAVAHGLNVNDYMETLAREMTKT